MAYDAVAIGPLDLAQGTAFIRQHEDKKLPWISANIYNLDGTRTFPPYRSIDIAGLRIGVIGLTDDSGIKRQDIVVKSWEEELVQLLPAISENHDLIVLLTTLPHRTLAGLSEMFPDIKIIVGADSRKGNINGFVTKNALLVQTADQGKYLGQLSVSWNGQPWADDGIKELLALKNTKIAVIRQLVQLNRIKDTTSSDYQRKKTFLEQEKTRINKQISEIEESTKKDLTKAPASSYSSVIIPLAPSIPEAPEIKAIVDSVKN